MVNVEEFSKENREITDLCEVLSILVDNADLRDNPVFCELFERFSSKIEAHLVHEDRSIYSELLTHKDKSVNEVADHFINNTHQLRKILSTYLKRWCKSPGALTGGGADKEKFKNETGEIFHLVTERISMENNKLFPFLVSGQTS